MHRSPDAGSKPDAKTVSEEPTPAPIYITRTTRDRLDLLKKKPDESYDTVISRLCDMAGSDAPLSDETLKEIEESLADLRKGISQTHAEIVQELVAKKEK